MAIWTLRFYVLNTLGLIDSLAALIAPAVAGGNPLFILLFYWACWRIPPELYESARLEGGKDYPAQDIALHRRRGIRPILERTHVPSFLRMI